ncbi:hypothetical protein ACS0TY_011575 [Phlomoides rotata]
MELGFRFPLFCILFSLYTAAIFAAPAPAADCSTLVTNMVDCLSFVTAGGTAKKPEGTCCSGLKTVLKSDAGCLCEVFKNSAQLGVTLNVTKALTLPAACHLSAPSIGNCALSVAPGAAPALSPSAVSPSSVAGAPTGGIGVNEGAPAPIPGNFGSRGASISMELFILTTLVAVLLALF